MFPPQFKQDLLARSDIVELIGQSVELKRAGSSWQGLCPFHSEKSPSFSVSPSRQTYHCFGCGVHGNAIDFLMEHHGSSFVEAVHDLAQRTGMAVPDDQSSPAERQEARQRKEREVTLSEVLDKASTHFRKQLKASPRAIAYLKSRGLDGEIAARFELGYAPEGWRGLASVFPNYDDPLLQESGLVIEADDDRGGDEGNAKKRYDRFRDRIMFPIRSVQGDVIAFGGRVLDAGEPKYLNSPETPIFVKGRELYGLFEARTALRQRGYALVVEGYMDVVALAQGGFGNAVATLGTACSAEHVKKLVRFTDAVVFSFDGDSAGRRAAARALEAALPYATDTRSFRFLFLPAEHDPDSYVRDLGAPAFEAAVAAAVPLSKQIVALASQDLDMASAEGRARFLAQAKPLWAALPEGMLRRQLLGELAARGALGTDELRTAWAGGTGDLARPAASARRELPRRAVRKAVRQPVDRVAWMLLLESRWWDELSVAEHSRLCAQLSWHGELFRFMDRQATEHGPQPWAVLRERIRQETWAEQAFALVDGEDPGIEPLLEELPAALLQLRLGAGRLQAMQVLGQA